MNLKQLTSKRANMAERAQQMLDLHFPGLDPAYLWLRKKNHGFTTIPRTLPVIMQAVDALSKSQPAGHVLFGLWARSPDNPFIVIENPAIFATEAGFSGRRVVDTWRRRMKVLAQYRFIATRPGASGDFHYVLLLNPNHAMEYLYVTGNIQPDLYRRFVERLTEVGGGDELNQIRQLWAAQQAAEEAAKAAAGNAESAAPAA